MRSRIVLACAEGCSSLKPRLTDTFKLSSEPLLIEKVHDVVGLYATDGTVQRATSWCARDAAKR